MTKVMLYFEFANNFIKELQKKRGISAFPSKISI
jgi:hypothetical protein